MTEFQNKSFSVYPGARGGEQYRENWERVFKKCTCENPVTVEGESGPITLHLEGCPKVTSDP